MKEQTIGELMATAEACPFCGGSEISVSEIDFEGSLEIFFECHSCNAYGPSRDNFKAALDAWNRRA